MSNRLLFFTAAWCPPCQAMKREKIPFKFATARRVPIDVIDIDTEQGETVAKKYNVLSIPTILLVEEKRTSRARGVFEIGYGKQLGEYCGGASLDDLRKWASEEWPK